jgi:hypothetical protein
MLVKVKVSQQEKALQKLEKNEEEEEKKLRRNQINTQRDGDLLHVPELRKLTYQKND